MLTFPPVALLDWLILIVVAVSCLVVLIVLLKFIFRGPLKPPYQQKPLFSPQANQALRLIDEAVGNQLRVFASVSLTELVSLNPALKKSQRELAAQQIYGEALDFVLCSPQDLKVRLAIVINPFGITNKGLTKREQRKQQQLRQGLQAAGIPIIELSAQNWPSIGELRADILTACKAAPANPSLSGKSGSGRVEPIISQIDDESELEQEHDEPVITLSAADEGDDAVLK